MVGNIRVSRYRAIVGRVNNINANLETCSDSELLDQSRALRYRAQSGERLGQLLPEAFALVREAARRTVNMRHFDVQLLGGVALFHGHVAEMETGEGKTLTATLPLYLWALAGRGAHLATVNDYLAHRDAEWMGPIFRALGLSVGCVQSQMPPEERQQAYACDVTYGTAKEFGFDFLRDRLQRRYVQETQDLSQQGGTAGASLLQREPYFSLVDEADSILIDEARTPLILSAAPDADGGEASIAYLWAAKEAPRFAEQKDYEYDAKKKSVTLNAAGRESVRRLVGSSEIDSMGLLDRYRYVERAIRAYRDFHRDIHYVVRDGEVVIVDEFTGRLGEGRRWQDGLHGAVEAKERVNIQEATGHAARVTVQDFFLRYPHLAGMTGSAASAMRELRRVYRLSVVKIPTNRPVRRQLLPVYSYATADTKWEAIVQEVRELSQDDRPVLIGTRTIEHSEHLSCLLTAAGIEHNVLNAHRFEEEAEIVAQAGQPGRVTVSTNMAGRGTDIVLDEGVADRGGLFVIGTELHESARIDRQLAGRCARQGDRGEFRQYLSLEDEILLVAVGPQRAERRVSKMTEQGKQQSGITRILRRAQRQVERRHARHRMILMHYERERRKLQREVGHDPYLDTAD